MTPKFKADKLIAGLYCVSRGMGNDDARDCAVICVEEILRELKSNDLNLHEIPNTQRRISYWRDVLSELNGIN